MKWFNPAKRICFCCTFLAMAVLLAPPSGATVIRYGDGTGNVTAPSDDPGWANVGRRGSGSAVYLGNGWVLTASHVGAGSVDFGGTLYGMEAGSWHQLEQPGSPGVYADLGLFRLTSTPAGVVDLTISDSTPSVGAEVLAIGYGNDRSAATSYWDADWNPTPPYVHSGFELLGSRTKRWGENEIDENNVLIETEGSPLETFGLKMDFDLLGGAGDNEMQVVPGDSGGGLFYKQGGSWELAGIIVARGIFADPDQPSNLAVYGNESYAADLSQYRDQILVLIPEPSTLAMLLGLGGAGCLVAALRRRAGPYGGR